jgi:hypothetical protein
MSFRKNNDWKLPKFGERYKIIGSRSLANLKKSTPEAYKQATKKQNISQDSSCY